MGRFSAKQSRGGSVYELGTFGGWMGRRGPFGLKVLDCFSSAMMPRLFLVMGGDVDASCCTTRDEFSDLACVVLLAFLSL